MSNLREQYERETGRQAKLPIDNDDFAYLIWLERRAACAEELAVACMSPLAHQMRATALAKYEAACKGEKS